MSLTGIRRRSRRVPRASPLGDVLRTTKELAFNFWTRLDGSAKLTLMDRAVRITLGVAALAAAGLTAFVLVFPLMVPVEPSVSLPAASSPTRTPTLDPEIAPKDVPSDYVSIGRGMSIPAGGPGDCEASAWIYLGTDDDGSWIAELLGADLVDTGAVEFAAGEVQLDEQGRPSIYTVAAGDVTAAIGDRFCIANGISLGTLNGYPGGEAIHPGDILTLNADLVTDWVPPTND